MYVTLYTHRHPLIFAANTQDVGEQTALRFHFVNVAERAGAGASEGDVDTEAGERVAVGIG